MRQQQLRLEMGKRMELAARSVGLGYAQVAAKIERQPPTVHRWWKGKQSPSDADLERYSEACGVSSEYLVYGYRRVAETRDDEVKRLVAGLIFHGWEPSVALHEVTEGAGGPAAAATEAETALLQESAHQMRELLWDHTAGQWDALTPGQRTAVLNLIVEIAKGNHHEESPERPLADGQE